MTIQELERSLIQIASRVDAHLNPDGDRKVGFALVAFEFGAPGGALAYLSNADRDGLRHTLLELVYKLDETSRVVTPPE